MLAGLEVCRSITAPYVDNPRSEQHVPERVEGESNPVRRIPDG